MKGVLLIAHGSRATETEAVLDSVVSMVKESLPELIIEAAFMGYSDRTVEKGVAALAAQNVSEIKVVPFFLFMGIHLKEDIPNMIAELTADHPDIKITMGEPLGADKRLADIVLDRIAAE